MNSILSVLLIDMCLSCRSPAPRVASFEGYWSDRRKWNFTKKEIDRLNLPTGSIWPNYIPLNVDRTWNFPWSGSTIYPGGKCCQFWGKRWNRFRVTLVNWSSRYHMNTIKWTWFEPEKKKHGDGCTCKVKAPYPLSSIFLDECGIYHIYYERMWVGWPLTHDILHIHKRLTDLKINFSQEIVH